MKKILTLSLMSAASLMAMDKALDHLRKSSVGQFQNVPLSSEQKLDQRQLAQSPSAGGGFQNNPRGSSAYNHDSSPFSGSAVGSNAPKAQAHMFQKEASGSIIGRLGNLKEDNAHLVTSRVVPHRAMSNIPELGGYLAQSKVGEGLNVQKLEAIKKMEFGGYRFAEIIKSQEEVLKKNVAKRDALNTKGNELMERIHQEEELLKGLETDESAWASKKEYEKAAEFQTKTRDLMAKHQQTWQEAKHINSEIEICVDNIALIELEIAEFRKQFEIQKNFRLNSERYREEEDLLRSQKDLENNLACDFFTLMNRVRSTNFDKIESVPDYIKAVKDTIADMGILGAYEESLSEFAEVDRRLTTTEALDAIKKNFKDHVVRAIQKCALDALMKNKYDIDATFVDLLKNFECNLEKSLYMIRGLNFKTKQDDVNEFLTLKESAESAQSKQRDFDFSKKEKQVSYS